MSINRNLGKVVSDLLKPDGSPLLANPTMSTLAAGTVSRISNLTASKAVDKLLDGKSTIIQDNTTTASSSIKNLPSVISNPMEDFASVNVLWTLAVLTPQQFNNPSSYRGNGLNFSSDFFMNSVTGDIQESSIVFSSGGRGDKTRTKTFYGSPEYFIDNFQMNCIIGASENTGNSNAIKFSFNIYEPYSMGLLLQSMQNAAIKAGYANYLDNAPYLLKMDVQGFDEKGIPKSLSSKYFTLKLTSMQFTVDEGGSKYKVEAIPYNHQGFSDVINTAYNDVKIFGDIKGLGNVVELLSTGEHSLVAVLNRNEDKLVKEKRIKIPDRYSIQFPILSSEWYSAQGTNPAANKATAKPGELSSTASVAGTTTAFPDDANLPVNPIGLSSLGFTQKSGGDPLFKRAGDQYDPKTGVINRDGMSIDPKQRAFQFGQGQTLTAMINRVILSSEYAKQALDPVNLTKEGYIKWFKLDVQVELLEFDDLVGDYAKKITYRVVPYFIHQSIFSNPNSAPIGYAELMKQIAKEYQYIYTGQNTDVLRFDIKINNLFYSGVSPTSENEGAQVSNQDQLGTGERLNTKTETGQGPAASAQTAQAGRARTERSPALLKSFKGGSRDKTTEQAVAENFHQAFISGNSADMVTVDLEILGDPYWLVDSGIGNYFSGVPSETSQITNDGSMNYESGNIYIYVTFRTPADINERTGLYDFSVGGKESPFGGIYRVNMVENYFADGMWKQKLKCLRMPGPQGPEVNKTTQGSAPVPISKLGSSAITLTDKEEPKTNIIDNIN